MENWIIKTARIIRTLAEPRHMMHKDAYVVSWKTATKHVDLLQLDLI